MLPDYAKLLFESNHSYHLIPGMKIIGTNTMVINQLLYLGQSQTVNVTLFGNVSIGVCILINVQCKQFFIHFFCGV
jgi:hypothetical protein